MLGPPDRRFRRVDPRPTLRFGLYALVGILVGLIVSALEFVTIELALEALLHAPLWVHAIAPGIGLVVTVFILRASRTTPPTSDEYVRVFHSGAAVEAVRS